jgi:hypothetical protein
LLLYVRHGAPLPSLFVAFDPCISHAGAGLAFSRRPKRVPKIRWIIRISEAARINKSEVWKHWRNPVRYMPLAELGIELEGVDFQPVAAVIQPPIQTRGGGAFGLPRR